MYQSIEIIVLISHKKHILILQQIWLVIHWRLHDASIWEQVLLPVPLVLDSIELAEDVALVAVDVFGYGFGCLNWKSIGVEISEDIS